ncbi:hypothetical protein EUA06_03870 [Nocardioides glacieisoli]|uniref:DUF4386 family protein n=1 Tax=Nocardioides glacieisoli TaxID=1168730 RepID=A0A4Q2S4X2_9ACTN|nr:hypothetical protein [Nocardioides glacieisoli]RYB96707.1 hypothetical protein EUA06_03870 [Nocardioides glacieisoli]
MTTETLAPAPVAARDTVPFGASAAIGGALALAACNALTNWVLSQQTYETTDDMLEMIAANRTVMLVADGLGFLAALLLVPGIWAVTQVLRERTPVLAGIGGWLAASGYVGFMVLVIEGQVALAVVEAGGDPGTYVDAMDNHGSLVQLAIYVVFGIGGLLGPLVLGIAMLRQRDHYPAWAGIALVLSPVVRMGGLALGIHVMPAVASLLMALAFAVVMLRRR